jgi:hypothetical protein
MIEAGISASYHIAGFFGLTGRVHQPAEMAKPITAPVIRTPTAAVLPPVYPPPPAPEINALPWPEPLTGQATSHRRPVIDVGAVITRALTAAGLMK